MNPMAAMWRWMMHLMETPVHLNGWVAPMLIAGSCLVLTGAVVVLAAFITRPRNLEIRKQEK